MVRSTACSTVQRCTAHCKWSPKTIVNDKIPPLSQSKLHHWNVCTGLRVAFHQSREVQRFFIEDYILKCLKGHRPVVAKVLCGCVKSATQKEKDKCSTQ